jgi:hypothetical protein
MVSRRARCLQLRAGGALEYRGPVSVADAAPEAAASALDEKLRQATGQKMRSYVMFVG